jgi:multisubunit Na+/H+ antiporter MnhB subunit
MNLIDFTEMVLIAGTVVLSILLSSLSISKYKRTGLRKMILASVAFSLFAVFSISELYEEFVLEGGSEAHPNLFIDIIIHLIPFVILILFFVGISEKRKLN